LPVEKAFAPHKNRWVVVHFTQPSIYDPPQPIVILIEHPSRLETVIAKTTKLLEDTTTKTQEEIHRLTDKWIGVENEVKATVRQTVEPTEPILAGSIYTAVATLAGTIVVRNRGIVLRTLTPLAFATAGFAYFLPVTSRNLVRRVEALPKVRNGVDTLKQWRKGGNE